MHHGGQVDWGRMGTGPEMKSTAKRILTIVTGWMFILLGIAGLFLPILQGILFILIGLIILSTEYVWAHHLLQKLRARFPRIAHMSDDAKVKAEAWMNRFIHRNRKTSTQAHDETTGPRDGGGCVPSSVTISGSANMLKSNRRSPWGDGERC